MVEVNITVKTDDPTQLQEILTHVVMEITDQDYRLAELNSIRHVDMNWVYLDEGRYQWSRNDRT